MTAHAGDVVEVRSWAERARQWAEDCAGDRMRLYGLDGPCRDCLESTADAEAVLALVESERAA